MSLARGTEFAASTSIAATDPPTRTGPVRRAFRDAHHICIVLDGPREPGFEHRMASFHGPGWRDRDDRWGQTFDAATYPQSVALARLLATPYWRDRILDEGRPWHHEFGAELSRTVAPDPMWDNYRNNSGRRASRLNDSDSQRRNQIR
jgi:hypothetical protein